MGSGVLPFPKKYLSIESAILAPPTFLNFQHCLLASLLLNGAASERQQALLTYKVYFHLPSFIR